MAAKKIEIIYDINGNAIDVAVDKTLNLKKQIVELTKALRSVKEGSDEFKIISSRLSDTQDELGKTTAKSKDLFTSLSMLPGPVGDFFGQLQGGIELLKTFSSFTFKDLQFQFKETANDIADIGKNISSAKGAAETGAATAAGGTSAGAIGGAAGAGAGAAAATNELIDSRKRLVIVNGELVTAENAMINAASKSNQNIVRMTAEERELYMAQRKATVSTQEQTVATEGLAVAEETATFWTNALNVALKAIGIGLVIAAVVLLVEVLGSLLSSLKKVVYEFFGWKSNAELAAEENEKLATSFRVLKTSIEETQDALKLQTELLTLQAKTAGKTEEEIYQIQVDGLNKRKEANKKADKELLTQLARTSTAVYVSEEERQKKMNEVSEAMIANGKKANDLYAEGLLMEAKEALRIADKRRENLKKINEKAIADNKEYREKIKADNKTADDALLKLLDENAALRQTDKRKREDEELKSAMQAEERTINALKISEEKKGIILTQIKVKYGLKVLDINAKRLEEDLAKEKEHTDKVQDWVKKTDEFAIQAIADQSEKEKAEKRKKYVQDLSDLDKALKDKLVTQDQYNEAVKNLDIALANDLKKIDDDRKAKEKEDKLKKLDDDIKFLQIQTDAEKNSFIAYWDDRKKLLDKAQERELLETEATGEKKHQIEKKYAQLYKDLQKEKLDAYLAMATATLGVASNFVSQQQQINSLAMNNELAEVAGNAEAEDKIKEKYFYKNRDAQVGQAIISTLQSAISAYSSLAVIPIVGPALGAVAAAAALVFGYKQVELIKAQKYQGSNSASGSASKPAMANYGKNYGDGGMIEGPRHSSPQGGVPIMAEGGEAIMTRGAVTMFRPLLSMLNQAGGGTSFTKGAMGQANFDNPKSAVTNLTSPQIIKSYVVSSELTTEQQKQARLKNLSTL